MESLTFEIFVGYLRSALHYLYEPGKLRRSPLNGLLGVANRYDSASILHDILIQGIEALRPAADESAQSRGWRLYDALTLRYVRCFDREIVAAQLGISGRQLGREQRAALEVLADHLWQRYDLSISATVDDSLVDDSLHPVEVEELAWLKQPLLEKPVDIKQTLYALDDLIQPLTLRWNVQLQIMVDDNLHSAAVPQLALRHSLLSLLNVLIPRMPGERIIISAKTSAQVLSIEIGGENQVRKPVCFSDAEKESLDIAERLAALCAGTLTYAGEELRFVFSLPRRVFEQVPILVVDDNADFLQLLQRYVSGTHFAIAGLQEPQQALAVAKELVPKIIILDVMMPTVDGWEVLNLLHHCPITCHTPIVICSILPQAPLALALGAHTFLPKPVTQHEFLALLDRLTEA